MPVQPSAMDVCARVAFFFVARFHARKMGVEANGMGGNGGTNTDGVQMLLCKANHAFVSIYYVVVLFLNHKFCIEVQPLNIHAGSVL